MPTRYSPDRSRRAVHDHKVGPLLAILSVIIYFLSRAIYRYWRGNDDKGYDEIHESLWSWAGFSGDLKTFLKGLGDRFRRAGAHASPPLACTMTEPQFLDVRELYRGLLWEGNRAGHPKPSCADPVRIRGRPEERRGETAGIARGRSLTPMSGTVTAT